MGVLYSPKIITDGLVLCLDAVNTKSYPGSGTAWTDLSGLGNNGTLINGPTFDSTNGSITFDGTNDYATASSAPSGTNLFTLSCWFYLSANLSGDFGATNKAGAIFSGNATGTMELLLTTIDANTGAPYKISFSRFGGSTSGSCEIFPLNMPINNHYNIVLVRDGSSSQKIYQNGALIGTGNVSTSFSTATLHLFAAPSSASFSARINGKLSNVLRYTRALTENEITQNFNALRGRYGI